MIRRVQLPIDSAGFDEIIDVRSPAEFAIDHMPGAINLPVLDDEQRCLIGTMFKQDSSFLARRAGAAIICRNIAEMIDSHFADLSVDHRILVYCWRGGQRSASLATILDAVGWKVSVLDGGYKAFRRHVRQGLERLPAELRWQVIQGPTGSGKTRLLHTLAAAGAQVLDLEALARHRASVLGGLPDEAQPSQRGFETALWQALDRLTSDRIVFVEAENRRIGRLHLPDSLWQQMIAAPVTVLEVPRASRVDFLLRDYPHFLDHPGTLSRRIDHLAPFQGRARIDRWQQWIKEQRWPELVEALLQHHYDPLYGSNSSYPAASSQLSIPAVTPGHLEHAAAQCLKLPPADA